MIFLCVISFYTFQTLSYMIDVYRGKIKPQKSLLLFVLYITMFPQLVAGPIVNYSDIEAQLADRSHTFKNFAPECSVFCGDWRKKCCLPITSGSYGQRLKPCPVMRFQCSWHGRGSLPLHCKFILISADLDMAIGMGKMLGFDFNSKKH